MSLGPQRKVEKGGLKRGRRENAVQQSHSAGRGGKAVLVSPPLLLVLVHERGRNIPDQARKVQCMSKAHGSAVSQASTTT
jgi:hypothetical protein